MTADAALTLELAVVVALVLLIVAIAVAAYAVCEPPTGAVRAGAAVHDDVERALRADTLVTCAQAKAAAAAGRGSGRGGTAAKSCAICLSDYAAAGDELVRVLPACGHFFHAECGIDGWLRKGGTCPVCRGVPWPLPLPLPARPECAPMPPRAAGRATVGPP